jgi:hypothetical protein
VDPLWYFPCGEPLYSAVDVLGLTFGSREALKNRLSGYRALAAKHDTVESGDTRPNRNVLAQCGSLHDGSAHETLRPMG